ncbi:unnamed protein product [Phytophthora lilii]|uniref:Unnamed protein product n=1 Tax=Phytophthora lilii TaxID=2077276 RepID=A0A9W6TRJ0_9STRA|nr:unnamed protein product [Phytophthora lilii]
MLPLAIGVDDYAIFNTNSNSRRSDRFQAIEGNADGLFNIGVDASSSPAILYYRNNGTSDVEWSTEFVPGTWYNFGIGVVKSANGVNTVLELYTSTGQDEIAFNMKTEVKGFLRTLEEFHIGPLTRTDGSALFMNAKQDVVSFNGMSAEAIAIDVSVPTPAPSQGGTIIVAGSNSDSSSSTNEARSYNFNDRQ